MTQPDEWAHIRAVVSDDYFNCHECGLSYGDVRALLDEVDRLTAALQAGAASGVPAEGPSQ